MVKRSVRIPRFCELLAVGFRTMEGPPLSRWELQGFRSVHEKVNLDLGPMNVLVGANSAGKSSLIQSILLAAQTLNGGWTTPRPLLLNGPLVQLGLPNDCLNEQSKGEFAFGFDFCATEDQEGPALPRAQRGTLSLDAAFSVKGANLELASCKVSTAAGGGDEKVEQRVVFERVPKKEFQSQLRTHGLKGRRLDEFLNREIVPLSVSEATLPFVVAGRFRQFLPWNLYEHENLNETSLGVLIQAAEVSFEEPARQPGSGRRMIQRPAPRLRQWREEVPRPVMKFVKAYLRSEGIAISLPRGPLTVTELLNLLPPDGVDALRKLERTPWFKSHHDELRADVTLAAATHDDPFDSLVLAAMRFFTNRVRHLGPIRLEPRPLYGLSEAASGDSVGPSGEFTAALLDAYGRRVVKCPLLNRDEVIETTLNEAVDYWLGALGLLSSVAVQEQGKLGYEINLKIEGVKKTLDLTAVGVGVSQALPVIVQGLVVPPGSLVMFEQPELHLHPDVQAATADFCMALARSGRQVIVETHSEYLVSRIRRRAVEDKTETVPELVKLHFVERETGATSVRPVELTSHGGLRDWPAGFMDQSAREAEAIFQALERRAAVDDPSAD